ncbi:MAG TPA: glycosyltransferase [Verrucomicrobiales bacterium]|nr:glycosyltransferase [Verrucomicrobiales bacterium]
MPESAVPPQVLPERPVAAGKYFRRAGGRWTMHGLTYGPFFGADGLPVHDQVARDLAMISAWGANTLRLFIAPPEWFLDLCAEHGLSVATGVAWTDHVDFLHSSASRRHAIRAVRDTARRLAHRRELAALFVGNEIQAPLVRWLGPRRVQAFLETLIDAARQEAPDLLIAYANYPTTEYLQPANADFTAFNVYLESPDAFDRYTARLQNIAGDRPLVISEFGVDVKTAGEDRQAAILAWQRRICQERGVAGNLLFSFTDEWHRGGQDVTDWEFGLTDRYRTPRRAWRELAGGPPAEAALLPARPPGVSVIVCTRNGSRTLPGCLASLEAIDYPDYEAIVVDDGSTEDIAAIVAAQPGVRYIRQEAAGLSVARNTGAAAATGEILAYTDDDCEVDPAWLIQLARCFDRPEIAAAGGPNIPPAPVSRSQACVIAAPGGPAHVLLSDTVAEHIPGCNMAIRRSVFDELGGFRPKYHAAGDDVDFCWRLLERGHVIAFNAAAMVWHYRRFSVKAFLKQQAGYGKAEALLTSCHSSRFGQLGGAQWRGVVYQTALRRLAHHASRIYSGVFGSASYQAIYGGPVSELGWLLTGFPWWILTLAVALSGIWIHGLWWLAGAMAAVPLMHTLHQAFRLPLPAAWSGVRARMLLWFLLLVQPVVRGWTRFFWNVRLGSAPAGPWLARTENARSGHRLYKRVADLELWSDNGLDRRHLLEVLTASLQASGSLVDTDDGWRDWDIETRTGRWWRLRFSSVTEYHGEGRCLTRVRAASRASMITVLLFALFPVVGLNLVFIAGWHPVWVLGFLFVGTVLFETLHRATVNRAANQVLATATTAGFTAAVRGAGAAAQS